MVWGPSYNSIPGFTCRDEGDPIVNLVRKTCNANLVRLQRYHGKHPVKTMLGGFFWNGEQKKGRKNVLCLT